MSCDLTWHFDLLGRRLWRYSCGSARHSEKTGGREGSGRGVESGRRINILLPNARYHMAKLYRPSRTVCEVLNFEKSGNKAINKRRLPFLHGLATWLQEFQRLGTRVPQPVGEFRVIQKSQSSSNISQNERLHKRT